MVSKILPALSPNHFNYWSDVFTDTLYISQKDSERRNLPKSMVEKKKNMNVKQRRYYMDIYSKFYLLMLFLCDMPLQECPPFRILYKYDKR